jgi:hypothetical protein
LSPLLIYQHVLQICRFPLECLLENARELGKTLEALRVPELDPKGQGLGSLINLYTAAPMNLGLGWSRGVAVITSALHAVGRRFEPGRLHLLWCPFFWDCCCISLVSPIPTSSILVQRAPIYWKRLLSLESFFVAAKFLQVAAFDFRFWV